MHVRIPDEIAEQLETVAKTTGRTPEQVLVSAVRRELLETTKLTEALAPVRQAFKASGLTEDEAVELFEAEKHALRRERRAAAK